MTLRPWTKLAWGIAWEHSIGGLLGYGWLDSRGEFPPGLRGSLKIIAYETRHEARAQVAQMHAFYAAYPEGHVKRAWRFRVARIRQTARRVR